MFPLRNQYRAVSHWAHGGDQTCTYESVVGASLEGSTAVEQESGQGQTGRCWELHNDVQVWGALEDLGSKEW